MNVLLVHGFLDTARLFRTLDARLTADGHTCYAPNLTPRDGWSGIAALSRQLVAFTNERFGPSAPFAVVGFSMGAIIARHYLQCEGGCQRARALFAISGPHAGTLTAYCYPGQGARDMRPGSPLLRELDAKIGCLANIPLYSYWTPYDLMILPASSATWPAAEAVRIPSPFHALMIHDRRLIENISQRLAVLEAQTAARL